MTALVDYHAQQVRACIANPLPVCRLAASVTPPPLPLPLTPSHPCPLPSQSPIPSLPLTLSPLPSPTSLSPPHSHSTKQAGLSSAKMAKKNGHAVSCVILSLVHMLRMRPRVVPGDKATRSTEGTVAARIHRARISNGCGLGGALHARAS